jgi:hypothetical protein
MDAAVSRAFKNLTRPVQKNLSRLGVSFVRVLGAARSGYGHLSLGALHRLLPTEGTPHAREKRLHRFLDNARLDPRGVTDGLLRLVVGERGRGLWPVLFDQTKSGATQALLAGVPFEGRSLPLAVYTFEYPWKEKAADSQNKLEHVFLLDLESSLPEGVRAVWIGDRGYARASLLRQSSGEERLYLIRGRGTTCVYHEGRKRKLNGLRGKVDTAVRYRRVLYQAHEKVPVDVVVYQGRGFKESWRLLVPPDSEAVLPTEKVVELYRERMQVEQSFRDFKTHLGLRGLQLKVRVALRTGRLLLAFCIAYCLAVVVGASPVGERARADLEIPRKKPRHGTSRTLSVLTVAMVMLVHPKWREAALERLRWVVLRIAEGRPALARAPPSVSGLPEAA